MPTMELIDPQVSPPSRIRFDPKVGGLAALGVQRATQLLGGDAQPIARTETLGEAGSGGLQMRFPLPGTPLGTGEGLSGSPAGAGTGWVVLERWLRPPLRALFSARFTHPRSTSLAERQWNLLCHLRAQGVGTPEPMCVGARGGGLFSRNSFLVTRELTDFEAAPSWLAREVRGQERSLGLRVIGAALGKLLSARVLLPQLEAGHFSLSKIEALETGGCSLKAAMVPGGPPGFQRNRMPSLVLTNVAGGVIRKRLDPADVELMLSRINDPDLKLSDAERFRITSRALLGFERQFRRQVLRSLQH